MYRKSKPSNLSDYNYFVKRNSKLLPYFTKEENGAGVHCLMPGLLSEGNLGRIDLHIVYPSPTVTAAHFFTVRDAGSVNLATTTWTSTVGKLKETLKAAYPNASKFIYLFSWAPTILIEAETTEYQSQSVKHKAVILDLYKEARADEDAKTIKEYFAGELAGVPIASDITAATANICNGSAIFNYTIPAEGDPSNWLATSVLCFATDDNASDCYTTVLEEDAVTPTYGAYKPYFDYRSTNSLRVACDSYGYQSGVMRDDVASFGKELAQQIQAYATKLAQLDKAAAAAYLNEVSAEE